MKFLVRCIKNTKTSPQKAEIKALTEMMVKASEDSFEPVRNSAFEGLGTMMKVIGEKAMNTFLEGLDDIKKGKIKEYYDKAEVKIKFSTAKKPPPAAAPSKGDAPKGKPAGKSAEKPAAKKEAVRHSFGIVNFICINIIVKYFNSFCPLWGICFEGFCTQEGSCKTGRPSKKSSASKSLECCCSSSKKGRKGERRNYHIQIF
jgi:hypothetical protein